MNCRVVQLICLTGLTNDKVQALRILNYNVVESTMMLIHGLFLNNSYEPLQDVRVRQALNYAD